MKTNKLIKSGLFIAVGILLPMVFHMLNLGGPVFLPMHIPVILAGFILGGEYGILVGIITPILSSIFTSMPPIFPVGITMMFELATYGYFSGYFYKKLKLNVYVSLILSMLLGRLVSGVVNYVMFNFLLHKAYLLKMFLMASFIKPIPGIIVQILIIPILVKMIFKAESVRSDISE